MLALLGPVLWPLSPSPQMLSGTGLGSGSAAGILAAIPVDNSTQPPRQDSAGLRSRPTICLGFLFGWPRRRGRSAASWPCHTEGMGWRESLQEWLGGWPLSQVRRCPQKEAGALCVSTACVCLKTWSAQEPAGSCSHLKGPVSGSLSKASVCGSSSLPFRCWPERWTGCHCSLKRVKGECLGSMGFVRQATVSVFCVFMPQFASALATVASQCCCLLADASPCILFSCLWAKLGGRGSPPLQCNPPPCPSCYPSPLAESSLLLRGSQIRAPRSRKLAVPLKKADSWL